MRWKKVFVLTILFLFTSTFSFAQTLKLDVKEYTLKNGLKILMVERHEIPRVVCHIYYKVGSVNEHPGITGISHLHEHMMFKGTKIMGVSDYKMDKEINDLIDLLEERIYYEKFWKRSKPDVKKIEEWQKLVDVLLKEEKKYIIKDDLWETYMKNGGSSLNASTGNEVTGYYVTLPSNKVELQMFLESDRMANPVFREFYSEKEVVREERRLSENRPGFFFREQLNSVFYSASPYSWMVLGWDIDLQKMTKKDFLEYNKKYYIPNNAVAVYVGDIDPENIISLAKKYFGDIPKGVTPEPVRTYEPPQRCEKRVYGEAEAPTEVTIMYHTPPRGHPDDAVFPIISGIMNGRTGRLYKSLIKEQGLAISAYAYGGGRWYAGQFTFSARPNERKGKTAEEVEKALYGEIEKLKSEPASEREIQKVKNQYEANYIRSLANNYYLASRIGREELNLGWRYLIEYLEQVKKVKAEDIMRVAKKYFVKNNRTVGILKRKK
ncbi:insulinase family protein [candidate division KSB1 bacterium]|nr:MAG: insulinase family protein [candidate division KSB1 bacterium]